MRKAMPSKRTEHAINGIKLFVFSANDFVYFFYLNSIERRETGTGKENLLILQFFSLKSTCVFIPFSRVEIFAKI